MPHILTGRGKAPLRWRALLAATSLLAAAMAAITSPGVAAGAGPATPAQQPIYRNTHYSFAERAADLVSRMTLAEKAQQLHTNDAPAIPRLGVQRYTYWSEGQHGLNRLGADVAEGSQGAVDDVLATRSEERRVGKECLAVCRSRWSPYH